MKFNGRHLDTSCVGYLWILLSVIIFMSHVENIPNTSMPRVFPPIIMLHAIGNNTFDLIQYHDLIYVFKQRIQLNSKFLY